MSWPTEAAASVEVWIGPNAVPAEVWPTDTECRAKPGDGDPIAQGVRGTAYLVYEEQCGETWLLVHYRDGGNTPYANLRIDQVTREPGKNVWDKRPALRTTTVGMASKPVLAQPLDEPHWTWPRPLAYGETVEVLDEASHVVRDVNGHELVVPAYIFPAIDNPDRFPDRPLEERAPRLRFVAGKAAVEAKAPITRVQPSTELLAKGEALRGHAVWLELKPDWLTPDRRFTSEWLDPTGQVLDHACAEAPRWDEPTPCGRYWLDYTAFGAWWPTDDIDVIGIIDGTIDRAGEKLPVLRLVVKRPWDSNLRVSPTWDGVDPGALQ